MTASTAPPYDYTSLVDDLVVLWSGKAVERDTVGLLTLLTSHALPAQWPADIEPEPLFEIRTSDDRFLGQASGCKAEDGRIHLCETVFVPMGTAGPVTLHLWHPDGTNFFAKLELTDALPAGAVLVGCAFGNDRDPASVGMTVYVAQDTPPGSGDAELAQHLTGLGQVLAYGRHSDRAAKFLRVGPFTLHTLEQPAPEGAPPAPEGLRLVLEFLGRTAARIQRTDVLNQNTRGTPEEDVINVRFELDGQPIEMRHLAEHAPDIADSLTNIVIGEFRLRDWVAGQSDARNLIGATPHVEATHAPYSTSSLFSALSEVRDVLGDLLADHLGISPRPNAYTETAANPLDKTLRRHLIEELEAALEKHIDAGLDGTASFERACHYVMGVFRQPDESPEAWEDYHSYLRPVATWIIRTILQQSQGRQRVALSSRAYSQEPQDVLYSWNAATPDSERDALFLRPAIMRDERGPSADLGALFALTVAGDWCLIRQEDGGTYEVDALLALAVQQFAQARFNPFLAGSVHTDGASRGHYKDNIAAFIFARRASLSGAALDMNLVADLPVSQFRRLYTDANLKDAATLSLGAFGPIPLPRSAEDEKPIIPDPAEFLARHLWPPMDGIAPRPIGGQSDGPLLTQLINAGPLGAGIGAKYWSRHNYPYSVAALMDDPFKVLEGLKKLHLDGDARVAPYVSNPIPNADLTKFVPSFPVAQEPQLRGFLFGPGADEYQTLLEAFPSDRTGLKTQRRFGRGLSRLVATLAADLQEEPAHSSLWTYFKAQQPGAIARVLSPLAAEFAAFQAKAGTGMRLAWSQQISGPLIAANQWTEFLRARYTDAQHKVQEGDPPLETLRTYLALWPLVSESQRASMLKSGDRPMFITSAKHLMADIQFTVLQPLGGSDAGVLSAVWFADDLSPQADLANATSLFKNADLNAVRRAIAALLQDKVLSAIQEAVVDADWPSFDAWQFWQIAFTVLTAQDKAPKRFEIFSDPQKLRDRLET